MRLTLVQQPKVTATLSWSSSCFAFSLVTGPLSYASAYVRIAVASRSSPAGAGAECQGARDHEAAAIAAGERLGLLAREGAEVEPLDQLGQVAGQVRRGDAEGD